MIEKIKMIKNCDIRIWRMIVCDVLVFLFVLFLLGAIKA